jgi:hypothetical protein
MTDDLAERVARVVAGVLRQAVSDAGAAGVVVLEPDSPEGRLLMAWSLRCFGSDRVWKVSQDPRAANAEDRTIADLEELARRMARGMARERNALVLHPANKTALLLDVAYPPEPVLPLGDLYASTCSRLAGGWTAGPVVRDLAEAAGGIEALDDALIGLFERRLPPERALGHLPERTRTVILQRLEAGRFWRRRTGLVPKLGTRTLGVDLSG